MKLKPEKSAETYGLSGDSMVFHFALFLWLLCVKLILWRPNRLCAPFGRTYRRRHREDISGKNTGHAPDSGFLRHAKQVDMIEPTDLGSLSRYVPLDSVFTLCRAQRLSMLDAVAERRQGLSDVLQAL